MCEMKFEPDKVEKMMLRRRLDPLLYLYWLIYEICTIVVLRSPVTLVHEEYIYIYIFHLLFQSRGPQQMGLT